MLTLLNRFSKYSIVILGFLAITLSHAQDERADDISILDVDANGEVDALTDGLLLLRSMFGLTDEALATGVIDLTNCTECDAEGIDSYIASVKGATYGKLNANDDQNISGSGLDGTTLTIGIEGGSSETVDLSSLEDGNGITADQASAIAANTAKTGITSGQTSAITANTAKTGITSGQTSAITANTAKTGITSGQASAITANTAKTGITSGQASAITANTAKTGITSGQASAIELNTAKTVLALGTSSSTALAGDTTTISSGQASAIELNTAKTVLALGTTSTTALAGDTTTITSSSSDIDITATGSRAIRLNASSDAGMIDIDAGTGGVDMDALGGVTIDAVGGVSIDAASASNFTTSSGALTVSGAGGLSLGTAVNGNITIAPHGSGDIELGTGSGGDVNINNDVVLGRGIRCSLGCGTMEYGGDVRLGRYPYGEMTVDYQGVQIGKSSATTTKVGFYGTTPVVRTPVADGFGGTVGTNTEITAKLNELIDALQALGLIQQ